MKRLLSLCAIVALLAALSTLLVPRQWMLEAGVFHAFLGSLAIAAALVANSVIARRRGAGPLGPGLPSVARTFWTGMAINACIGCTLLMVEPTNRGPDNYPIGPGAFMPIAVAMLAGLVCAAFAATRWWPSRLFLATAAGCTAAFSCMAVTWWL